MNSSGFPVAYRVNQRLIPVALLREAVNALYFQPEGFPRKRSTLGRAPLVTDGLVMMASDWY